MAKETKTEIEIKEPETQLIEFHFPDVGVTIFAENYENAVKILTDTIKK
jgi:hypothetical protein